MPIGLQVGVNQVVMEKESSMQETREKLECFDKGKLRKTSTCEKNSPPTREAIKGSHPVPLQLQMSLPVK
ncbi:hypothetical protein CRUP_033090 [Coryphaenoides rupestris]|nr:hypothetical protein CRUP_033090 [Coryphaenoides rupestris]